MPELERSRTAGRARFIWRSVFLLLLAVGFVAIELHLSSRIGRLSGIPNYDDVAYLNTGSEIYFLAKSSGVGAVARYFFTSYLHSPFVVFNAFLGFVLFGPKIGLVYFMLTAVVFAYLGGVAFFARRLPAPLFSAVVIVSLCLPFAGLCAVEFRPDLMWATLLGAAGVAFLAAERPFENWKKSLLYGAALGGVLLVKPSTFAMSLLVMGGVWLLAATIALRDHRGSVRQILAGLGVTLLAALLVAGWYVVPHATDIFSYFYRNSFGDYKDVWSFKSSLWERWTYYVHGYALASNLGPFLVPLLAVYVGTAGWDILRGPGFERLRGAAFLWMLVALFAVNGAFGMKSPFLGGSFYGFLIFGAIWNGCRLLQKGVEKGLLSAPRRQVLAGLALLALAALGCSFPLAARLNAVSAAAQRSINKGTLQDLFRQVGESRGTSLMVTHGNPLVWEYLQMEFRRRRKNLVVRDAKFLGDPESVIKLSARVDFVALQDPLLAGRSEDAIPGERLQTGLLAYFSTNPEWHLVGRYSDRSGKFAYLYGRVNAAK